MKEAKRSSVVIEGANDLIGIAGTTTWQGYGIQRFEIRVERCLDDDDRFDIEIFQNGKRLNGGGRGGLPADRLREYVGGFYQDYLRIAKFPADDGQVFVNDHSGIPWGDV